MPLVFDPSSLSPKAREELRQALRADLGETRELVEQPSGRVIDPASLETAAELLRSALANLDLPGPRSRGAAVADINLAYATLLAVIDLVKSHTDVPRVPRARKKG
ncbi:MAG: hypothetical protein ACLP8Y_01645 [Thermoplasmata archaeon]